MSDKEENPPVRRGPEAANRNKKKEKKRSPLPAEKAALDEANAPVAKQSDPETPESKKPEPEIAATMPSTEPVGDNPEGEDDFSPETSRTKPVFDPPGRGAASSGQGKFFSWFIAFAVALILVAVGEAYYAHFLVGKEQQAREALSKRLMEQVDTQVKSQIASQVEKQLSGGEEQIHQVVADLKGEFGEYTNGLSTVQRKVAAIESTLHTLRTKKVTKEKGPKPRAWDIAEVAYLLRIANERLHLGRDINTALVALQTADQILHKVADPALTPVRSQLAQEINSLKAVPIPDINGMALSLTSLTQQVNGLKLKQTALEKPIPAAANEEKQTPDQALPEEKDHAYAAETKEFFQAIWADLKHLVVVKHRDEGKDGGIPILLPKERYFLYQNLKLELEASRLSLLRRDKDSFQQSLEQARNWLQTYFQGPKAKAMEDTLAELKKAVIKPPLPDISESLKILEHVSSQAAGDHQGGGA